MVRLLAVLVLAFGFVSAAVANTYSLDITPSTAGEEYAFNAPVSSGAFTDTWQFNVLGDSVLDGIVYSTSTSKIVNTVLRSTGAILTNVSLLDELDNVVFSAVPTATALTSPLFNSFTYSFAFNSLPLVPQTYKFVVSGNGFATNASYNGFLVATNGSSDIQLPVPEPESYLMMLVGLATVGFKLRKVA